MKYISSDTDIWIDYNIISRTDLPFRLPCTYIMYKESLQKKIIESPKLLTNLQESGLVGVELTIEEFFYADELSKIYVQLSACDRIALAMAKFRKIPLLTKDNLLRKAAVKEGIEVLETIDLLDKLYNGDYITKLEYLFCLESLLEHQERRLSTEELQKRIDSLR